MEFFTLEPWGTEIDFMRTGIVAAAVVNVAPNRKPGAKPASPKDFMPEFGKQAQRPDRIDPKQVRANFLEVFGDRIKRKDKGDGGAG